MNSATTSVGLFIHQSSTCNPQSAIRNSLSIVDRQSSIVNVLCCVAFSPVSCIASAIMRAIQLEKPQHFRQIEIPAAAQPGVGEALVRVHRVGICGTDFSGYLGKMPFYSYPRIPGHELGIEVAAIGSGVTNVKPGDRCSVEPYIN